MVRIWGLLACAAMVATACSDDAAVQDLPTTTTSTTTSAVPIDEPPAVTTTAVEVADEVEPSTTSEPEPADDVAEVRLRGTLASVDGGVMRLCRTATASSCQGSTVLAGFTWDAAPVVPREELWGEWHPQRVEVEGTMRSDGSVAVTSVALESAFTPEPAHCPDRATDYPVAGGSQNDITTQIIEYTLTIRDELGGELTWDSSRGIRIVRVINDPAPHQRALDAVAPGHTCVIQVTNGRHELGLLRMRLSDLVETWRSYGYGDVGVSVGVESNLVEIDVAAIDQRIWADIGDDRDLVWPKSAIEVVDDQSVDVLSLAAALPPEADADRLFTGCLGVPVDPAVFDEPADDRDDGHPSNALFDQTAMPGIGDAGRLGWWRVYESPDRVVYVNDDRGAVEAVARDGFWSWAGSNSCQLEVFDVLGLQVMTWEFDALGDGDGADLILVVTARGCPSVEEGDLTALVEESEDRVIVTVLRPPALHVEFCQFVDLRPSEVSLTVPLTAPLGGRVLLDGGQYPAAVVS